MLKAPSSWLKLVVFIVIPLIIISYQNQSKKPIFLDPVSTFTPDLSYFPKPSPTPKVKQTTTNNSGVNTPETTENIEKLYPANAEPQPSFTSEEIHGFFEKYSNDYHIDINILRHIAVCESDFNPRASNLSYVGLFQFSKNTWIHYRNLLNEDPEPDLRLNIKESVKTAAYVLSINQAYIWPNCIPKQ